MKNKTKNNLNDFCNSDKLKTVIIYNNNYNENNNQILVSIPKYV